MTRRMLAGATLVVDLDAHVHVTSQIRVKNLTLISLMSAPPTPPSRILKLPLLRALRQTIVLSQHVHLPCLRVAHSRHLKISSTIFGKHLGCRPFVRRASKSLNFIYFGLTSFYFQTTTCYEPQTRERNKLDLFSENE